MDDPTQFEDRFADRVRAFASTSARVVDSAAVARAVAVGHPRSSAVGLVVRRLGLAFDRRAWAIAVVVGLVVVVLGGALLVGARLLQLPPAPETLRLSHLVYVLDDDIYVADWDGADPVRIVDGDPGGTCRDWVEADGLVSPDGRMIAYRSNSGEGCQSTVIITDLEGDLVASLPGEGRGVAWSPDSTRVATWLTWGGPKIGIYGVDGVIQAELDGSRVCCDQDFSRPVWSRDGESVLVRRHNDGGALEWELPVNGDPPRPLLADDPRSMALYERPVDRTPYGTQRQPLAGVIAAVPGAPRPDRWEQQPVWSAAGDRVAYPYRDDGGSELWVVYPTTGVATMLASARPREALRPAGFSADGNRLLFVRTDVNGQLSLWSVSSDGSGDSTEVAGTETWGTGSLEPLGSSPQSDRILLGKTDDPNRDPASNRSLWSVNADGSGARMLVEGADWGAWLSSPINADQPSPPARP